MSISETATQDWIEERLARADRATKSWRWLLLAGLLAIFAGFVVLSIYLNDARVEAEKARDRATEIALRNNQRANALANTLLAATTALRNGDEQQAMSLLAEATAETEEAAAAPLPQAAAERSVAAVAPPALQPEVTNVLASAAVETPRLKLQRSEAAGDRRVFIQFAGSIPRREIVELNQALREAGWNVQGASGERIASAAGLNEVRYSSEADQEAAEALAEALSHARVSGSRVTARQLAVIAPGTLEAWISR